MGAHTPSTTTSGTTATVAPRPATPRTARRWPVASAMAPQTGDSTIRPSQYDVATIPTAKGEPARPT